MNVIWLHNFVFFFNLNLNFQFVQMHKRFRKNSDEIVGNYLYQEKRKENTMFV